MINIIRIVRIYGYLIGYGRIMRIVRRDGSMICDSNGYDEGILVMR
jgi:hypothetical protein